jgi:hypothetical protein
MIAASVQRVTSWVGVLYHHIKLSLNRLVALGKETSMLRLLIGCAMAGRGFEFRLPWRQAAGLLLETILSLASNLVIVS